MIAFALELMSLRRSAPNATIPTSVAAMMSSGSNALVRSFQ